MARRENVATAGAAAANTRSGAGIAVQCGRRASPHGNLAPDTIPPRTGARVRKLDRTLRECV